VDNFEIEKIYKKYFSSLVLYAIKLTGSIEDAEDVVQDAFLKQIKHFKNKDDKVCEKLFLEYLKNTIRQLCINLQKKTQL
jgi:RNA polymerase sigma factor (sigma-70 family)